MEKLIATKPIYYKGKNYVPGEEIPAADTELAEAWKRAGSVKELSEQANAGTEDGKEEKLEEERTEEAAEEPVKKGKRGK